jgi:hypothetical protein
VSELHWGCLRWEDANDLNFEAFVEGEVMGVGVFGDRKL